MMETFSFLDIIKGSAIKDVARIEIPKIQRDYAQGRDTLHATDIRNLFTGSLIATLKSKDDVIQPLDFVYGYIDGDAFQPLDGQQRLTTLFLLHWLVLPNDQRKLLIADDKFAVLSYLTRPSAKDFSKFLTELDFDTLSNKYDNEFKKAAKEEKDPPLLSDLIKEIDDYRYNWNFDPTVISMLRMIDSFMSRFGTFEEIKKLDWTKLNNIRFHYQELPDLHYGDDLYVKMNARGLELSDFDNTKSTLESDMILGGIDEIVQKNWRENIDRNWIDFFWHRAGADEENKKLELSDIKKIEDDLKIFILRLNDLKWFERLYGKNRNKYEENLLNRLTPANSKRDQLSQNLMNYVGLRFDDIHSVAKGECPVIDFKSILDDFNNFLFEENNIYFGADTLVPEIILPKDDSNTPVSVTDILIDSELTYNNRVFMYGIFYFLKLFPAEQLKTDHARRQDFKTWLRVLRNFTLPRNGLRYDEAKEVAAAKTGVETFLNNFHEKLKTYSDNETNFSLSEFLIDTDTIAGLDISILEEEKIKESLRKNKDWEKTLDLYENTGYLFGQLRAPLNWSGLDIPKFKTYADFLNRLMSEVYSGQDLYAALLLITDPEEDLYPFQDTLLLFNNSRDWSFKRYLREFKNGVYAPALFKLAKKWEDNLSPETTINAFLKNLIEKESEKSELPLWKSQLVAFPEMMYEYTGGNKRGIDKDKNYEYLIASIRKDKEWNINLCWLKKTKYKGEEYVLHHTKEENEFKDSITKGKTIVASGQYGDLFPTRIPHGSKYLLHAKGLRLKKMSDAKSKGNNRKKH